ncbi:MAG: 2-oxoglutarate and iron-dependent oxygenase domain-containing protein [Nostoc sp. S4]|nr:2-oxoglutarate and iron-dependent oxygenase domain-containing protein [Nostoc sp. S4]
MKILPVVNERFLQIPIVDISSALVSKTGERHTVASEIKRACCEYGFFYIVGHGIDENLQQRLELLSRQFFAQDLETKLKIRMTLGGKAWQGYFPVGCELTSDKLDQKEGIYFGGELGEQHPLVQNDTPMHGSNLFPSNIPLFRETVLEYMEAITQLGHKKERWDRTSVRDFHGTYGDYLLNKVSKVFPELRRTVL